MKKDKLYLIISVLFVTVAVVLTNGFKGSFSAPTGDLGGTGNLYWAIDGSNCDTDNSGCTFKISNNSIDGDHYVYGKYDGNIAYYSEMVPWYEYSLSITNVVIGGEDDIISPKSTFEWFDNFKNISTIDFTYLDTSNVTNMSYMFYYAGYNVNNFELDLSNFDTSKVTSIENLFGNIGYNSTTFKLDLSNWDMGLITNMSRIFSHLGYNATTFELNLSNWNVSNVTNMSYMFEYAGYNATSYILNLDGWDTGNVTNMEGMFYSVGYSLSNFTLDLNDLDVSSVENMSFMFYEVGYNSEILIINIDNWDTSKVENMSFMFIWAGYNAKSITLYGINKFNTSNVTNMSRMFESIAETTTTISMNLSNWDVSSVEDMSYMFYKAGELATHWSVGNLSNWDVSNVTDMTNMFAYTGFNSSTWSVGNISNWDVSSVEKMEYMFEYVSYYNSALFKLDLSNWNTSNVTDMSYMFYNVSSKSNNIELKIDGFNTSKVTNMEKMFYNLGSNNDKGYLELDLSNWDTSNVTNSNDMFSNLAILKKIKVGNKWNLPISNRKWMNQNTGDIYENGNIQANVAATYILPTIYWGIDGENCSSSISNCTLKISNKTISGSHYDSGSFDLTKNITSSISIPWADSYVKSIIVGGENDIVKPLTTAYWFYSLSYASNIDLTYLDTSQVTNMTYMFYYVGYNTTPFELDLSRFDTSKVTNLKYMFIGTNEITRIKVGEKWTLPLSDNIWKNDENSEVYENGNIPQNVAATYVRPIIYWEVYGEGCNNINANCTLKISNNFISDTFNSPYHSKGILEKHTDILNYSYVPWKNYSSGIKNVVVGGENDIVKPLTTSYWFYNFEYASNIDLTYLDTSNVTNMSYMFEYAGYNSENLKLDLSSLDTSNVTNMSYMFEYAGYNASNFELDLSGWDTSNVTNMSYMFYNVGHNAIPFELDLSSFDTSQVTGSEYAFYGANLTKIKVGEKWTLPLSDNTWKNINTGDYYENGDIPKNVAATYIIEIFYWAIDGENCNTSGSNCTLKISNNLIDGEHYKFGTFLRNKRIYSSSLPWYSYNNYITNVIIGGENDIVKPLYTTYWFYNFINVEKIDLKYLNTSNVIDMESMFRNTGSNSNKLELDLSNLNTSNVTNMQYMFYDFESDSLNIELDLSNWNTEKVTLNWNMFQNSSITKIKVGDKWTLPLSDNLWKNESTDIYYRNGDIPKNIAATYVVASAYYIYWKIDGDTLYFSNNNYEDSEISGSFSALDSFYYNYFDDYKDSIKYIVVGSEDDIVKPLSTANWFNGLTNVEDIDLRYLDTSSVVDMSDMFADCNSLESIDVSNFNTKNVTDMTGMFASSGTCNEDGTKCSMGSKTLKEIKGLENFNTSNVTNMMEMFMGQGGLKTIDVSSFDTSKVESMAEMFACTHVENYDMPEETSSIIEMLAIMKNMNFDSDLKEIKGLENFDVTSLETASYMFMGLNNIEELDLSKFGQIKESPDCLVIKEIMSMPPEVLEELGYPDEIILYSLMMMYCSDSLLLRNDSLSKIKLSNKKDFYNLEENQWVNEKTGVLYEDDTIPDGEIYTYISPKLYWKVSDNKLTITNNHLTKSDSSGSFNSYTSFSTNDLIPWHEYSNIITSVQVGDEDDILKPYVMDNWFSNLTKVKELDLSYIDSVNLKSSNGLFNNMISLEKLDLSNLNLDNIPKKISNDKIKKDKNLTSNFDNKVTLSMNEIECIAYLYNCEQLEDESACQMYNDSCQGVDAINESNCAFIKLNCNPTIPETIDACNIYDIYCKTYNKVECEKLFNECNDENDESCGEYDENCKNIGITDKTCLVESYKCNEDNDSSSCNIKQNYCPNVEVSENLCKNFFDKCYEDDESCEIFRSNCMDYIDTITTLPIFNNNNNLLEITVSKNNIKTVKESLENPSSEYITGATGVWYDIDLNEYDSSELPEDVDATYYAVKPTTVSYGDNVKPQGKLKGIDLKLYDEIIKESDTSEIITKFDTDGGNNIEDVTLLKITTYTLKNFTDKDGNIYLPGSIYTLDEDLELTVNYEEEVHYNEIELPIPVRHGYKFEYWTLDGEKISEYTPKSNETLVAVFSEIKYNFVDNEIEYEKENTMSVIFETDGIIENFKNLYVNGKKLELGKDYVIDENKIILTNNGIEYLDSLEPGEYEVRAEFSDSNSDVYGIIKVSEKEVVPEDEPKDNPITPKTSDYILFTIIIALTALISSIFIYKKIEY